MIRKWIWSEGNTFSGDSFAHQGQSTSPAEKLKQCKIFMLLGAFLRVEAIWLYQSKRYRAIVTKHYKNTPSSLKAFVIPSMSLLSYVDRPIKAKKSPVNPFCDILLYVSVKYGFKPLGNT